MCDRDKIPLAEATCLGTHQSCVTIKNDIEDKIQVTNKKMSKSGYRWKVGPWKSCTETCGGGFRLRRVVCFDTSRNAPSGNDRNCAKHRPKPRVRAPCNQEPCNKWIEG